MQSLSSNPFNPITKAANRWAEIERQGLEGGGTGGTGGTGNMDFTAMGKSVHGTSSSQNLGGGGSAGEAVASSPSAVSANLLLQAQQIQQQVLDGAAGVDGGNKNFVRRFLQSSRVPGSPGGYRVPLSDAEAGTRENITRSLQLKHRGQAGSGAGAGAGAGADSGPGTPELKRHSDALAAVSASTAAAAAAVAAAATLALGGGNASSRNVGGPAATVARGRAAAAAEPPQAMQPHSPSTARARSVLGPRSRSYASTASQLVEPTQSPASHPPGSTILPSASSSSSSSSFSSSAAAATLRKRGGAKDVEVTIHVYDESKKATHDFVCERTLLIAEMQYFETYLADSPKCDKIEISVHCDVKIFHWLINYVKATNGDTTVRMKITQ